MHDHPASATRPRRPEAATEKAPGHVLLARLGKRVLRPGGIELTGRLLADLGIGPGDDVVELAPGLGATARTAIAAGLRSYVGVEADPDWAARLAASLPGGASTTIVTGDAAATNLDAACASVVFGEAMLTMHSAERKRSIVGEACRVLRPGGRYGIHELCLTPNELAGETKAAIGRDLSLSIHVGARPLTVTEWTELLRDGGLEVATTGFAPMHLLEPRRVLRDEGVVGTARIVRNVLGDPAARARVMHMRRVFRTYADNLAAVAIVGVKP